MRKTVLIFVSSLFLYSCEKEKITVVENAGIPLIAKVLASGEPHYIYTYNEANMINEEKSKFLYVSHKYNGNNQLIKSEFYFDMAMASSCSAIVEAAMKRKEWISPDNCEKSLTQLFRYDDQGHLYRKYYSRSNMKEPEYSEFKWESDKIIRQTFFWNNSISNFIDYFYDEKGNLIREERYDVTQEGKPGLSTTTEYEYDNMHNPYQTFKRLMIPGKYTNPNNIVKETYTLHFDVDPWIEKVQVTRTTYEYNDADYPVRINGSLEYIYNE